jgi:two-component system, sensor histidine kinase and response regulator
MNSQELNHQENMQETSKTEIKDVNDAISDKIKDHSVDLENYYLMLVHDLQEKIAGLKNLAEQQSREKSLIIANNNRFISIIGHDLRGPLSSILGVMSLMKEFLYDLEKKEIEEYVDIASASALNTTNLLENLLLWATTQNVGIAINKQILDLYVLVEEEIANNLITTGLKKINLTSNIAPDMMICADNQMVKTIFRNLINNAIKFTNVGGDINISAVKLVPFVEITVKDNGRGIPSEDLDSLFLLNAVIPENNNKREKGRGLGLLLCREFVEMHGGNIRVESSPGQGSRFVFTLPLHTDD